MTLNLWNYPADLWPHLVEIEARREQVSRDWATSDIEPGAWPSIPSWLPGLLRLLGPLTRQRRNQNPGHLGRPPLVCADAGEDDEIHICRGENLRSATRPAAC